LYQIEINGRLVGQDSPCFVIAEAGVNHNGDLNLAKRLVDAAYEGGADAVKFQTFTASTLAIEDAPKADYQFETTSSTETQFQMLKRLELTASMHSELKVYSNEVGILFMSSPFDESSADLLSELGVEVFKIPSGEITNLPLLDHVARKGKPMIVSTGMSYLSEVEAAVRIIESVGNQQIILLHCVSNYPADPSDINLSAMNTLREAFNTIVGYSDHTQGIQIALAAVALGAKVIEKHITLDCNLPGPDHRSSLEPAEFEYMVNSIRSVESALGHGRKEPAASEMSTSLVARKSLMSAKSIPMGSVMTLNMMVSRRPGTGLAPTMMELIIGRKVKIDIAANTILTLEMFD